MSDSPGGGSQDSYEYCSEASSKDDDDDFQDDDMPVVAKEPREIVMSGVDVVAEQNGQIAQIASLLECSLVIASVLLRKYQWSTEKLLERYYEDPDKVLAGAGVSAKRQKSEDGCVDQLANGAQMSH